MTSKPLKVPQISQTELVGFHEAHFSSAATAHFAAHFFQPHNVAAEQSTLSETTDDYFEEEYEDDDGLGYYPDGVKRTLTDEQIAIFRHSELEALRRARESTRIKKTMAPDADAGTDADVDVDADNYLSDGEISSSMPTATATPTAAASSGNNNNSKKKKKKRKRGNNSNGRTKLDEEPIDLRKRTWDVVEKGLATLDYGDEEGGQVAGGDAMQRRRISYDD